MDYCYSFQTGSLLPTSTVLVHPIHDGKVPFLRNRSFQPTPGPETFDTSPSLTEWRVNAQPSHQYPQPSQPQLLCSRYKAPSWGALSPRWPTFSPVLMLFLLCKTFYTPPPITHSVHLSLAPRRLPWSLTEISFLISYIPQYLPYPTLYSLLYRPECTAVSFDTKPPLTLSSACITSVSPCWTPVPT